MRGTLLKARDPSVLACNLIDSCLDLSDQEQDEVQETEKTLMIYLRIKGGITTDYKDLYEIEDQHTLISKIPESSYSGRNIKDRQMVKRKYKFSKIFGPEVKQHSIFDKLVKSKLLKFINGYNGTLMTYGVSSSGKTYTFIGTPEEPGIIPRSLNYLFRTLPEIPGKPKIKPLPEGRVVLLTDEESINEVRRKEQILNFHSSCSNKIEYKEVFSKMQSNLSQNPVAELDESCDLSLGVWISFAEIYNEHIHDLLAPDSEKIKTGKNKLKLGNLNGEAYIKNLTLIHATNGLEAYQILQYGLHRLNYAKTKINDHSSRSHSIFTIRLAQATDDLRECCVSNLNFCDLAGAERSKKTMNVGKTLKESNNINTSLLVLGRCIAAVRNAQKTTNPNMIPFRESKLTQLFQKALSGQENIAMMVNVNPCKELFDETQHVLNFSAVAKEVIVTEVPKTVVRRSDRFSQYLQAAGSSTQVNGEDDPEVARKRKELEELKEELQEWILKIDMEEMDQEMELRTIHEELNYKYHNEIEKLEERLNNEYKMEEIILKREMKEQIKAYKLELAEEDDDGDLDLSSSSDEEEIIEGPLLLMNRKRKHQSPDVVEVYSSDEEEDIDFWVKKVESQERQIEELEKLQSELEKKYSDLQKAKTLKIC